MPVLLKIIGTVIVLVALVDIFLTVLHPRADSSLLSVFVARGVWSLFQSITQWLPKPSDRFLSYSGPTVIVTIISVWVLLLLLGFALIIWPALGDTIQMESGETPTDFGTAIYYAGYALATLGTGDLLPQTVNYRLLMVLKSILGFAVFTLTLSFVTSVYSNLTERNTFALSLHHGSGDTADSTELLARLAADNNINTLHQDISEIGRNLTRILESNNSYPVLFYFRYRQPYYTLPRITYMTMDTATLLKTALDAKQYRAIIDSAGVAELWFGGLHLLEEMCCALLPKVKIHPEDLNETQWRSHYYHALERLRAEGMITVSDPEKGADDYVEMRHQWAHYLAKLTKYMAHDPKNVFPAEYRVHVNLIPFP